jgi:glycosyltransferase involved in cell wall biosynthesis
MRVLLVHNRYRSESPSGENAVVEDEARLLAGAGCLVERLEVSSDEIASWPARRRATLPLRVAWSRAGYSLTESAIRRFRPAVVHFHNTFPLLSPSALWAARRSGAAVVYTVHNFRPLCPAGTFLRDGRVCEECLGRFPFPSVVHGCYRDSRLATSPIAAMDALHRVLRTWQRCVDVFVFPSQFARAKYVEAGWPSAKLVVKYNTTLDDAAGRVDGHAGFACISRLTGEKGVDVLLDAWPRAFPEGSQSLRIVGSGDQEAALRTAACRAAGVDFSGRLGRAETLDVLARSLALVVPSRSYEVFPRVVVEAYALGVPVIGARLGALAEIVEDETTGLLFEPGSAEDLADALERLKASPGLAATLGRNARRAYETRFSPEQTTQRLLAIYDAAVHCNKAA